MKWLKGCKTNYMRRLIYKEDHQMSSWTAIIFETDCNVPVKQMAEFTWHIRSAGRLSPQFGDFQKIMKVLGYEIKEIKRLKPNTMPENNDLEIVVGATGNY